ncbi:MAG: monovalent cation/H(+) antiporter subunit G [Dehalococcoidales bacterium]|jgi:multicomponent Na+:H+ antiporter subunit G|nr:monovalent cation/H(+) antiporter subunit G [Dehalococcoidales bacterium]MDD3264587.1 monovalent cation/H(+) antiporter subunit G [Dehalococcoidales bacterium]MDD4322229.1 monovalent cation/H(+) antiporter subunit G [Dehalococcoidales bacterium]MDD4793809.1 monovalent cation/H(+) antiporter subunit G [Dehalococcoidales bacterium]MDD5121941.1 monovalent cation/H(+) antiporter subunit G [Dehalococcoidales bacterium]
MNILAGILIAAGLFFLAVSCIGLVRLPDFYTRNHAAGKSGTLGAILILVGLAIYNGFDITVLRLFIILLFFAVTSPTATHAVARAAYRLGLEPWTLKNQNPEICNVETREADEGAERETSEDTV